MTRSVCVAVALVTLLNVVGAMHSINRVLMPLSLKKKLCEQNPDLKICLKETGLKKRVGYFEYSFWDVCDSRPYIPLCRLRPAKEPKGGIKEVKMEEYHTAIEGSGLEIDSETTSPEQPTFTDSTNLQPNYL
ncbi:hypothetical protein L596_012250 [Steinernema carpocapsae]|uniref:Uncharacterized protein n=1 Tax=Steinernema carpocapsae TaxID=34508 RepID=A0A4U5NXD0_STECR|nr:hypothetical protein L596_012250 [Steinernema carpocapsae]